MTRGGGGFRRRFRIRPRTDRGVDAELRDELAAHIALAAEHLIAAGVPRERAEAEARARFGNLDVAMPQLYASAHRRESRLDRREWLHDAWRDVQFGARQLRRSASFAVGVVLVLGFGIGSSATVFSWMEGLVLRPLPAVYDVERVVSVRRDDRSRNTSTSSTRAGSAFISLPEYREWRAATHSMAGLAASSLYMFGVDAEGGANGAQAEPFYGVFASDNYFEVLGVKPVLGRAFNAADDQPATAPVAIISHKLWQTRFGGATDVIGRHMRVNGYPVMVVGVGPAGFGGTLAGVNFDLWLPLHSRPFFVVDHRSLDEWTVRWVDVIGRLATDVTMRQANAEFGEIAARLGATHVENRGLDIRVDVLDTGPAEQLRPLFWALIGLTVLVVLIVCSNVANLLLVRGAARAREIGVRLSLGATRARLVRQLMTENLMLALMGAALGVVVAWYGRGLLAAMLPTTSVPLVIQARVDVAVLGFIMGIACLSVVVFGLAPALMSSRVDLTDVLKSGGRGSRSSRSRLRSTLVVAQFALSLTSLVCGALFLKRSEYLQQIDRGFRDPEHVLLVQTDMAFAGGRDLMEWQRTVDAVVERLGKMTGASAATAATFVPLGFIGPWRPEVGVEGYAPQVNESMRLAGAGVAPGYFDLMGIRILEGRAVIADDTPDRPGVAVVNEAFVKQFSSSYSAIGRHITLDGRPLTIVGVARNGKYDYKHMDDPSAPLVYYAMRQSPNGFLYFHVRTSGDPFAMVAAARRVIASVDPRMPIVAPTSLAEYTAVPMFPSRLSVAVLGVLSAAALLLAAMGLYAIIAYGVALRTREIGIRLALGGTSYQVVKIFVRETVRLLGAGVLVGSALAGAAAVVLHTKLVVVPLPDVLSLAVPVGVLSAVALVAGFVPARRSAAVDLASTLRAD